MALHPQLSDATAPLWRETERDLLTRFPGMSVDDLLARRDYAWFGQPGLPDSPVDLAEVLRTAAARVVSAESGVARPMRDPTCGEGDQRRTWRWLTFSLPADLLLANLGASSERLAFLSGALQAQLNSGGYAETHLHLRAALSFGELWASLMRVLARSDISAQLLASPGADWQEGRELGPMLLQCAVARQFIGAYLSRGRPAQQDFRTYVQTLALPGLNRQLGVFQAGLLWRAVVDLSEGRLASSSSFPMLRHAYAQLVGVATASPSPDALDPLSHWFAPLAQAPADFLFTAQACAHLRREGRGDGLLARVFWQCVRARVAFYRHVVQRPMVPGLQWFIRAYARLSGPRQAIPTAAFVANAARLAGPGCRSLEVRLTPEDRFATMLDTVRTLDRSARQGSAEFGVVIHFARLRGGANEAGRPRAWGRGGHDDPSDRRCNPSGYRFSGYFRAQLRGAVALAQLIHVYPRTLEVIRGIDLCTDELAVPLWVLRPLMSHVARVARTATAGMSRSAATPVRPLGTTVHVGEDFVHLLGGIRRIAEAVEVLQMGEGERLGHAVALGVDVQAWATRTGLLRIPRGERLLDLIWVWRTAPELPALARAWLPVVEQQMMRIGAEIFGRQLQPASLAHWWVVMHDERALRQVGFPNGPARLNPSVSGGLPVQREAMQLLLEWLTHPAVFQRSQRLETVHAQREIDLTQAMQDHVRAVVSKRSLVVEVNPSSNLLIGHLSDLAAHPLWRLSPPMPEAASGPSIRVAIGSDDPITFATSLPEEYQLVADALAEAGVAPAQADAWLRAAQRCGLEGRFTVARSGVPLHLPTRLDPPTPLWAA